jgi:hypothetical protein
MRSSPTGAAFSAQRALLSSSRTPRPDVLLTSSVLKRRRSVSSPCTLPVVSPKRETSGCQRSATVTKASASLRKRDSEGSNSTTSSLGAVSTDLGMSAGRGGCFQSNRAPALRRGASDRAPAFGPHRQEGAKLTLTVYAVVPNPPVAGSRQSDQPHS